MPKSVNRHLQLEDVTLFVPLEGAAWHRSAPQQGPLSLALGAQQSSAFGKCDKVLGNCLLQPGLFEVRQKRARILTRHFQTDVLQQLTAKRYGQDTKNACAAMSRLTATLLSFLAVPPIRRLIQRPGSP